MAGRLKFSIVISHNSLNPSSLSYFLQMRNCCPEMLNNLLTVTVSKWLSWDLNL